jgi:rubrerythrin
MKSPIHKEVLKEATKDSGKAEDVDAVSLGIEQEKRAIQLYVKCAEDAESDVEREIYQYLVSEEKAHLLILEAEKDGIKGSGYWLGFREFTPEG